jgi:hypothetical protein
MQAQAEFPWKYSLTRTRSSIADPHRSSYPHSVSTLLPAATRQQQLY